MMLSISLSMNCAKNSATASEKQPLIDFVFTFSKSKIDGSSILARACSVPILSLQDIQPAALEYCSTLHPHRAHGLNDYRPIIRRKARCTGLPETQNWPAHNFRFRDSFCFVSQEWKCEIGTHGRNGRL